MRSLFDLLTAIHHKSTHTSKAKIKKKNKRTSHTKYTSHQKSIKYHVKQPTT